MTRVLRTSILALSTLMAASAFAQSGGNDSGADTGGGADGAGLQRFDTHRAAASNEIRRPRRNTGCDQQIGFGNDSRLIIRRCDQPYDD